MKNKWDLGLVVIGGILCSVSIGVLAHLDNKPAMGPEDFLLGFFLMGIGIAIGFAGILDSEHHYFHNNQFRSF